MLNQTLQNLFRRDLDKLKQEIGAYKSEEVLWQTSKNIPNSAGNLCLHLIGNLSHFIGATLGSSGYVRHRDLEFSSKNIPRGEMLKKIDETIEVVDKTLSNISAEQFAQDFPIVVFEEKTSTEWMLAHLATHLNYHLGQINYHRRLLDATDN
jgi:uncharacterized damage-inducible protein DinB